MNLHRKYEMSLHGVSTEPAPERTQPKRKVTLGTLLDLLGQKTKKK